MSNAFDIEAAKRGEPIEYKAPLGEGYWEPAHFIGMTTEGDPVIQYGKLVSAVFGTAIKNLRMAPKKIKVRYRDYVAKTSTFSYRVYSLNEFSANTPRMIEKYYDFVRWIHADWQEVEITE